MVSNGRSGYAVYFGSDENVCYYAKAPQNNLRKYADEMDLMENGEVVGKVGNDIMW